MTRVKVKVSGKERELALRKAGYIARKECRHHATKKEKREIIKCLKQKGQIPNNVSIESVLHEMIRQESIASERAASREITQTSLQERLCAHLVKMGNREIKARNLSRPAGWFEGLGHGKILDYDPKRRLWVMGDNYMYHYSNQAGDWYVGAAYLCGKDDAGYFAVRISQDIAKIDDALESLKPMAVKKAEKEGRWVGRQGDVYFVELKSGENNFQDMPSSHKYDPSQRIIVHREHQPLAIPENVKAVRAYRQIAVGEHGRTASVD